MWIHFNKKWQRGTSKHEPKAAIKQSSIKETPKKDKKAPWIQNRFSLNHKKQTKAKLGDHKVNYWP